MSLLRTLDTGLRGILTHRLRSVLTTLGILFGVAAVICTVGIGTASSQSITARIAALGWEVRDGAEGFELLPL